MALIVQKYGGTSVGSVDRIQNVARRVAKTRDKGNQVVVTVSAMGGETDRLLTLARSLNPNPPEREMDVLLSTGEQASIALLTMALEAIGIEAVSLTGAQAGIVTDGVHTRAKIVNITPGAIHQFLDEGKVIIVAGFQGRTDAGQVTTLGRGGSDLTAIAIAGVLGADLCQIFTDVDGVYTCDPRVVKNARKIDEISYDEMLEMASSGTKVMQSRAVEFGKKFGVPFEVRSSLNDNPGTIVKEETQSMEGVVIRGVSIERKQAKATVGPLSDEPGQAARLFTALAAARLNVDMIVQNVSSANVTDISFTVHEDDLRRVEGATAEFLEGFPEAKLRTQGGIAKLSVVGIGMRSHSGVAARLFEALAAGGVNIQMISTSEIKITVVVNEEEIETACNLAHAAFELEVDSTMGPEG